MNRGKFIGNTYFKEVNFSKAVLWKDKQISLSPTITKQFRNRGTKKIIFQDNKKREQWIVDIDTARKYKIYKKEGQEYQFYLPISIFHVIDMDSEHDWQADIEWFDNL